MAKQLKAEMEQEPSASRGEPPPHAPLGTVRNSPLAGDGGLIPALVFAAWGSREVVQNIPGAGSLFPTLLSVGVAVGREEGRGGTLEEEKTTEKGWPGH